MDNGQKFVMVQGHQELHITACAVVKNSDPAFLESFNGSKNYFAEPNAKWRENPADEWAWIKIYHHLYPEKNPDSEKGQVIRTDIASVSLLGRATQGVRIMRVESGDGLALVVVV